MEVVLEDKKAFDESFDALIVVIAAVGDGQAAGVLEGDGRLVHGVSLFRLVAVRNRNIK